MATIPQKEPRNNVGAVLRRAEAGEEITITVAGGPVAQLGPISGRQWVGGRALRAVWRTSAPKTLDAETLRISLHRLLLRFSSDARASRHLYTHRRRGAKRCVRSVGVAGVGDLVNKSGVLLNVRLNSWLAFQFLRDLPALIRRRVEEATQRGPAPSAMRSVVRQLRAIQHSMPTPPASNCTWC